jgi:hypothetical protein
LDKSLYSHSPAFSIADFNEDQNASAVKLARELHLFEVEHGSWAELYCLTCSTVIFPALTHGTSALKACCAHDIGDCVAETLVGLPFEKVAVTLTFP